MSWLKIAGRVDEARRSKHHHCVVRFLIIPCRIKTAVIIMIVYLLNLFHEGWNEWYNGCCTGSGNDLLLNLPSWSPGPRYISVNNWMQLLCPHFRPYDSPSLLQSWIYKDTRLPALRVVVAVPLPRHAARVLVCIVLAEHHLLALAHPFCPQEWYPVVWSSYRLICSNIPCKILLAADSSSSSPNVVVCLLFVCLSSSWKMLANCYLTAT